MKQKIFVLAISIGGYLKFLGEYFNTIHHWLTKIMTSFPFLSYQLLTTWPITTSKPTIRFKTKISKLITKDYFKHKHRSYLNYPRLICISLSLASLSSRLSLVPAWPAAVLTPAAAPDPPTAPDAAAPAAKLAAAPAAVLVAEPAAAAPAVAATLAAEPAAAPAADNAAVPSEGRTLPVRADA